MQTYLVQNVDFLNMSPGYIAEEEIANTEPKTMHSSFNIGVRIMSAVKYNLFFASF